MWSSNCVSALCLASSTAVDSRANLGPNYTRHGSVAQVRVGIDFSSFPVHHPMWKSGPAELFQSHQVFLKVTRSGPFLVCEFWTHLGRNCATGGLEYPRPRLA